VVATFYNWRKKYREQQQAKPEGFCKIVPRRETAAKRLCLPSGLEVEITGMTTSYYAL